MAGYERKGQEMTEYKKQVKERLDYLCGRVTAQKTIIDCLSEGGHDYALDFEATEDREAVQRYVDVPGRDCVILRCVKCDYRWARPISECNRTDIEQFKKTVDEKTEKLFAGFLRTFDERAKDG